MFLTLSSYVCIYSTNRFLRTLGARQFLYVISGILFNRYITYSELFVISEYYNQYTHQTFFIPSMELKNKLNKFRGNINYKIKTFKTNLFTFYFFNCTALV